VVIDQLDRRDRAIIELEYNAPICADRDGPVTPIFSLKRMKSKAWNIEIINRFGGIEICENDRDAFNQVWSDQAAVIVFK